MQQQLDTDLYEVLGVSKDATQKDIKRAYKKLAQQFHPDVNQDNPAAAERFKEISAANDVLSDATKRAEYDEFQSMVSSGFQPGFATHGGHGAHDGYGDHRGFADSNFSGGADLNDLLGQMFNSRQMRTQVVRVEIEFADAVRGIDVSLGDAMVHLPAGVQTGDQLMVRGSERNGGADDMAQPDLLVEVVVGSHPQFGRTGLHLTLDVPISITEAVLGGKVKVPAFDGKPIGLKIPAGTPHGRTFRVKGRGIDTGTKKGDLLVSVQLQVPTELNDEQTETLRAYAAVAPTITHPNRI